MSEATTLPTEPQPMPLGFLTSGSTVKIHLFNLNILTIQFELVQHAFYVRTVLDISANCAVPISARRRRSYVLIEKLDGGRWCQKPFT